MISIIVAIFYLRLLFIFIVKPTGDNYICQMAGAGFTKPATLPGGNKSGKDKPAWVKSSRVGAAPGKMLPQAVKIR
jgi:hypothetical protein